MQDWRGDSARLRETILQEESISEVTRARLDKRRLEHYLDR
jgi:hypothetical protein